MDELKLNASSFMRQVWKARDGCLQWLCRDLSSLKEEEFRRYKKAMEVSFEFLHMLARASNKELEELAAVILATWQAEALLKKRPINKRKEEAIKLARHKMFDARLTIEIFFPFLN